MFNFRVITLAATVAISGAVLAVAPLASAKGGDHVECAASARRARRPSSS